MTGIENERRRIIALITCLLQLDIDTSLHFISLAISIVMTSVLTSLT
ncbi:MAG: hypothetical protein N838_03030 [Thiohalocapsa sp. PB-PSB1]|nr:MAG: hypothetical protein N838_03030 [Thiohalocapsa sp. PB-PSB1]